MDRTEILHNAAVVGRAIECGHGTLHLIPSDQMREMIRTITLAKVLEDSAT